MNKTIIFSCHAPSRNTLMLNKSSLDGIKNNTKIINLKTLNPQEIVPETILNCDGIIIGTTENIGYMSGLTKDMFDRCYNFWLNRTDGIPVCIYIRAGLDGTGTKNSIESIVKSLNWKIVQPTLILKGDFKNSFNEDVINLSGAFAAGIENNIF